MKELGDKIRELLKEKGWNQAELCRRSGVPPGTLSNVLARGTCTVQVAVPLGRALGVSLDWLLDPHQDWPPPSVRLTPVAAGDLIVVEQLQRALAKLLEEKPANPEQSAVLDGAKDEKPRRRKR